MADLNRSLGAPGVDAVGDLAERPYDLRTQPELGLKRERRAVDAGIGQRSHAYSSFRHAPVIVAKHVGRVIVFAHAFESGAPDRTVAQLHRTDPAGSEEGFK